jgi:hypothetical protein
MEVPNPIPSGLDFSFRLILSEISYECSASSNKLTSRMFLFSEELISESLVGLAQTPNELFDDYL